jgi:hypothetical protein
MTTFRARGVALGLLAVGCAALACGGREPAPIVTVTPTITLTDKTCVADGLGALAPQHFVVILANATSSPARFNLQRMQDGHVYGELEAHIAEQQRRFVAGIEQLTPPSFTTIVTSVGVEAAQSGRFDEALSAGVYGLVCRGVTTPTIWSAYVIGPFRVP